MYSAKSAISIWLNTQQTILTTWSYNPINLIETDLYKLTPGSGLYFSLTNKFHLSKNVKYNGGLAFNQFSYTRYWYDYGSGMFLVNIHEKFTFQYIAQQNYFGYSVKVNENVNFAI